MLASLQDLISAKPHGVHHGVHQGSVVCYDGYAIAWNAVLLYSATTHAF